jgi:hypothetical protein
MSEAPLVDGEEAWIERVVLNLVGNAAKYSPADAPIIVTLEVDAGEVLLRVLDRGMGLKRMRSISCSSPSTADPRTTGGCRAWASASRSASASWSRWAAASGRTRVSAAERSSASRCHRSASIQSPDGGP